MTHSSDALHSEEDSGKEERPVLRMCDEFPLWKRRDVGEGVVKCDAETKRDEDKGGDRQGDESLHCPDDTQRDERNRDEEDPQPNVHREVHLIFYYLKWQKRVHQII